jgi:hypothetical protein
MADRNEEIMGQLALKISIVYSLLVDVCEMLPVPIGLPISENISADDAIPAIRRVIDVGPDQPMGETQAAQLHTGCIHLLAAIDLYALCSVRYLDHRAEAIAANLLYGEEALNRLETWLAINQAD